MREDRLVQRQLIVPAWFAVEVELKDGDFWVEVEEVGEIADGQELPEWLLPGDFLAGFYAARRRRRETSRQLAHIDFCQATDAKKLENFVRNFGPVLSRRGERGPNPGTRTYVQNVEVLRTQQVLFAAVQALTSLLNDLNETARLLATTKRGNTGTEKRLRRYVGGLERERLAKLQPAFETLAESVRAAVLECQRRGLEDEFECVLADVERLAVPPAEVDKLAICHQVVCDIFNLFPPGLYYGNGLVQECPTSDDRGIRPLLYFMLREAYVMRHRIRLCKRVDCGCFFMPDRGNEQYCSDECLRLVAQRNANDRRRLLRETSKQR